MINRHTTSPFWTPERDLLLKKLRRAALPADKIAAQLGVTRNSVVRRFYHLRGLTYSPAIRISSAEDRRRRKELDAPLLAAMRKEIRKGVPRNVAIASARKAGASLKGIREELGASRVLVWRALVQQDVPRRTRHEPSKAAIPDMRRAISRGMRRNRAIAQAYKSGATHQAIANELGLTRQRVHQIVLWEQSLNEPLPR
jgi:biotin operon repressor